MPLQNTVITQWIVFGLSLAAGIGSLVAQFLGAGNYTPSAVVSLVVAALMFALTQITKQDQKTIMTQLSRMKAKK
jgi:hypothetical protein